MRAWVFHCILKNSSFVTGYILNYEMSPDSYRGHVFQVTYQVNVII
jgi:hypothetical protein